MRKILKLFLFLILATLSVLLFFYFSFSPAKKVDWGVNFSVPHAQYLGLDYKELYRNILYELKPKNIRLMAYWETIEAKPRQFDFSQMDYLLEQADQAGIGVILVVGHKQPRWPECHEPDWYKNLNSSEKEQAILNMLEKAVVHYKKFQNIRYWQVENEPFFNYGQDCPISTKAFLQKEVALVKSLDIRPVVITDSGEKGWWIRTAKFADILGSTMYRVVYNPRWGGYIKYPVPAAWYRAQAGMVKRFTNVKDVIGVELQAEPWFVKDIRDTSLEDQIKLLSPQNLEENIAYAKSAGFKENYFWGVEWWYYMKKQGNDFYWERAKSLFKE